MFESKLVFYGVRGSYPVPGKNVGKYGGNTASIMVEVNDEIAIFDAGTGIIRIGKYLKEKKSNIKKINIFLTHLHIDHILGLPFFDPVFDNGFSINIYCDDPRGVSFKETIFTLFDHPLSPIGKNGILANINFFTLDKTVTGTINLGQNLTVDYLKMKDHHPLSGVTVYRIKTGTTSVVYATDIESPEGFNSDLSELVRGVDILIHDSQYLDADYYSLENSKKGYGHSTVSMAVENALQFQVKKLYLFHYSPEYSDKDIEGMLKKARERFKNTFLAKELIKINLRR
jgi:ribonuclease BN (tRNA processing enzyme)